MTSEGSSLKKTVFTAKADTPIEIRASNEKYIFGGEFFAKKKIGNYEISFMKITEIAIIPS